jgi:hypothetical protein
MGRDKGSVRSGLRGSGNGQTVEIEGDKASDMKKTMMTMMTQPPRE